LTSFNKGDTKQSSTDKPVALRFQIELEFRNVGFLRREEKPEDLEKNPHMTPGPAIKRGPHWWEASALTTGPSLLPDLFA